MLKTVAAGLGLAANADAAKMPELPPVTPLTAKAPEMPKNLVPPGMSDLTDLSGAFKASFLQPQKSAADLKIEAAEENLKNAKKPLDDLIKKKDLDAKTQDEKDAKALGTAVHKYFTTKADFEAAQVISTTNTRQYTVPKLRELEKATDAKKKLAIAAEKELDANFPGAKGKVDEWVRGIQDAEKELKTAKTNKLLGDK